MIGPIQQSYESVYNFNKIASNLNVVDDKSISAQLDFILEEFQETVEAHKAGDAVKTLDGACDLFVTVTGLMQKLGMQGYNVSRALQKVCDNNMEKFPKVVDPSTLANGYVSEYNPEYDVCVIKDANGKIRKPHDFKAVDLTDCVPK